MIAWPSWETIPFHFVWISLTLLYGFRVWSPQVTMLILAAVVLTTGGSILADAFAGIQLWGELFEVPLMSAMFLAMVWHARRRVAAIQESEALAESRATLLARQERFLHDVTHELRTPVTIARGHLELLQSEGRSSSEVAVALDELGRIERIITRLLLLAKADRPDFLATRRGGRRGLRGGRVHALVRGRPARLAARTGRPRAAHRRRGGAAHRPRLAGRERREVHRRGRVDRAAGDLGGDSLTIEVADGGCGVPPAALDRIFERFGRADDARARADGGVGLGLSIAAAIAKAHGGTCTVESSLGGTVFALSLPAFRPAAQLPPVPSASVLAELPAVT